MSIANILLAISALCFVAEALGVGWPAFHPKWWALGVAFYIFSQLAMRTLPG